MVGNRRYSVHHIELFGTRASGDFDPDSDLDLLLREMARSLNAE